MNSDVIIEVCSRSSEESEFYKITFSTEETLEFSGDEVAEYGLYREGELCENFEEMCTVILAKRMMASVASYVLFSAKTSYQVKSRLEADAAAGKFAPEWERFYEDAICEAIRRLEELKYIDDVSYAEKYAAATLRGKPVSRSFILNELIYKKGIERDIAETAVDAAFENDEISDEDNVYRLLHKKTKGHVPEDRKELEKLYRFSAAKGFSFAVTESALKRIEEEDTEQYE